MSNGAIPDSSPVSKSKLSYGWFIVFICTLSVAISYGVLYSYSVFFKPIVTYFNWDRATVSSIYSVLLVIRGATSIGIGWLADKYGPAKMSALCGVLIGLGLILTSRVSELWQLYLTYGLIEAIGLGGAFTIGTSITSQWFTKNRGLALGIVSSGSGLGTLLLVPAAGYLIDVFNWSTTFLIFGVGAGAIITGTSFLLRRAPVDRTGGDQEVSTKPPSRGTAAAAASPLPNMTLGQAIRTREMMMIAMVFFSLLFCTQMLLVHLVNFATDTGISPLVAASLISLIGMVSIGGRLLMGSIADRIGTQNSLFLCCALTLVAMIFLIFAKSLFALYIFAAVFGLAYGGGIPLIPMLINQFCGTRSMAALVGVVMFVAGIGGALGPVVGGAIFDATSSYHLAFVAGAGASLLALLSALLFKRLSRR